MKDMNIHDPSHENAHSFKEKWEKINREGIWMEGRLKEISENEIKSFTNERKHKLEAELEEHHKKIQTELADQNEIFLADLMKPVIDYISRPRKYSEEEDKLMISIINTHRDLFGYFSNPPTPYARYVEHVLTMLYVMHLERWKRKYGRRTRIEETHLHFLSRIPMTLNFVSPGSSPQETPPVKKVIEKIYYFRRKDVAFANDVYLLDEYSFQQLKFNQDRKFANDEHIEEHFKKFRDLTDKKNSLFDKAFNFLKNKLASSFDEKLIVQGLQRILIK